MDTQQQQRDAAQQGQQAARRAQAATAGGGGADFTPILFVFLSFIAIFAMVTHLFLCSHLSARNYDLIVKIVHYCLVFLMLVQILVLFILLIF